MEVTAPVMVESSGRSPAPSSLAHTAIKSPPADASMISLFNIAASVRLDAF